MASDFPSESDIDNPSPHRPGRIAVPDCPALVATPGGAVAVSPDGEVDEFDARAAFDLIDKAPALICHAAFTVRRLQRQLEQRPARAAFDPRLLDILELFAFVRPAEFCLPTPAGLARRLDLAEPAEPLDQALTLHRAAARLLADLGDPRYPDRRDTGRTAQAMAQAGWSWGPFVMAALGAPPPDRASVAAVAGFDVWNRLPDWEERAPRPAPGPDPVTAEEARGRLAELTGPDAETRAAQADYAAVAASAFAPRDQAGATKLLLAEAGTGIGKTLGYVAPASLWAERNKGTVWISTYTKNLQRQLDQELGRLFPDPKEKAAKAVIRKGRENYLCLLNFEEFARRAAVGGDAVTAGLAARWARYTRDGDMVGGDFPAWLGPRRTGGAAGADRMVGGLTDRRGECVYSACQHYRKCFVEKAVRKARTAEFVVANHALVMTQAALDQAMADLKQPTGDDEDGNKPEAFRRLVFDEGHHVFDAADGAFAAHLSAIETAELRRWIRGPEGQRGLRARGLTERASDLIGDDADANASLDMALRAAAALPGQGWGSRLGDGRPQGPAERFLALVRQQVLARTDAQGSFYSLETETAPPVDGLLEAAAAFDDSLHELAAPLTALSHRLRVRLDEEAAELETPVRTRIEAVIRGLDRRARITLPAWRGMLSALGRATPPEFVDWLSIDRIAGRDHDVGMNRHWVDPTVPFAAATLERAHGVLITSATLRDRSAAEDDDKTEPESWASAEIRTGATHLPIPAKRASFASPFDYAAQARVLVVRDVARADADQVAAAYRELFLAAGGGALGLFTAINRLTGVHQRLLEPLEAAGLPLYAQHVDAMDTGTLVDIFRAERDACLLGTDAVRDGVDVPGPSLRLIVFDRTPWPRPDILHKARREAFGGARYDDMLTRLRLKQAFGRLIRSADDRGVFVMLDSRLPTRLTTAFPHEIDVQRLGLADAVREVRAFLAPERTASADLDEGGDAGIGTSLAGGTASP